VVLGPPAAGTEEPTVTERKDFKRVVRDRALRTGESSTSALRNVRKTQDRTAATVSMGKHEKVPPMTISRAIPEVRTSNVDKTVRFYTELLGFDVVNDNGSPTSFVSSSHPGVEVRLNPADFALPPGFTVEIETPADLARLFETAAPAGVRVIDPPREDGASFSVLDPAGRRITLSHPGPARQPKGSGGGDRPIVRTIPGTVLRPEAAKPFYAEYLGFDVRHEWPEGIMFEGSRSTAQVLAGWGLTSPDSFDLDVGSRDRVDAIYSRAVGHAVVMGAPEDFPAQGIRCFLLIDPNGVAINVAGHL
jgi:catechol 2,3-dioxygenase-like lactoylglutathione lyase family enzyme